MTKKILAISLLSAVLTPVVLTWAVDMMTILAFTGRSKVISGGLFGDDTIECWYRSLDESYTRAFIFKGDSCPTRVFADGIPVHRLR